MILYNFYMHRLICMYVSTVSLCVGLVEGGSKHDVAARCTILFTAPPQQINVTDPQTQLRNVYSPLRPPSTPARRRILAGKAIHVNVSDYTRRL